MEEKEKSSKGFSLRKKRNARPAISAPRPQAQTAPARRQDPLQLAPQRPPLDASQAQPREKTSDLVKRRYSSRFVGLPPGFDPTAPPVPALPPGAGNLGPNAAARQKPPGSRDGGANRPPPTVDLNALRDPNLQVDSYVANVLADASEQDIVTYQTSLHRMRNRTSTDLQQNVYQNRTQFIRISKEAEKLKSEMRTLRHLMSELRANTNALSQESLGKSLPGPEPSVNNSRDSASMAAARKQANRSSVANLEAMWNTQLHTLWKNVEGSQKFLPASPGRHVIRDSPHWVELNAATWKARRAIHIFLLNDHLLVASRKRKRVDPSSEPVGDANSPSAKPPPILSKLVAERCWPLQDIEMTDLSSQVGSGRSRDASTTTTEYEGTGRAINIRVGQESFTYRHDRADGDETTGLLLAYRKAVDELARSLRAEALENLTMRDRAEAKRPRSPNPSTLATRPASMSVSMKPMRERLSVSIDVDGKQQNMRWVETQLDELDISLALQRFGEAVDGVERLRRVARGLKSNATAQEHILRQTDERAEKLAIILLRQLIETHSSQQATQRSVTWLTRLGFDDRAREAYLEARRVVVNKRARQFIFEGNLPQYIFQLTFVIFTIIRNTVTVFQACFPPLMMSACVKWAVEQVERFNLMLTRQLSTTDSTSEVYRECMERVKEHVTLLTEVGLDFRHLVGVRSTGDTGTLESR
ncbi:MAG: citrate synthase [Watsoniomyces obsoletus]|nr:MAG: citrate synthase [Watsoniomyces obsoletus]